jgi:catechol 2,3-dioxygenase-like lactoylglutathione lyase family enzyme
MMRGMAGPSLFRVILPVSDTDQATAFYERLLGVTGERVSGNRHYFRCGEVVLALVEPAGEGRLFRPNLEHVYFSVENLGEALERAEAAGCGYSDGAHEEPRIAVRPWGERSFYVQDPFGNPLCFVEAGTEFLGGRFVP